MSSVRLVEARCSVVRLTDARVINIIIAQPSDAPPIGCELIEVVAGQPCDIGWYWDGVEFINSDPAPWSDIAV